MNYLQALFNDWWMVTVIALLMAALGGAGWICYKDKDKWP